MGLMRMLFFFPDAVVAVVVAAVVVVPAPRTLEWIGIVFIEILSRRKALLSH